MTGSVCGGGGGEGESCNVWELSWQEQVPGAGCPAGCLPPRPRWLPRAMPRLPGIRHDLGACRWSGGRPHPQGHRHHHGAPHPRNHDQCCTRLCPACSLAAQEPDNGHTIVGFGPDPHTLTVVTTCGSFYKLAFDPVKGGQCQSLSYCKFLDKQEAAHI